MAILDLQAPRMAPMDFLRLNNSIPMVNLLRNEDRRPRISRSPSDLTEFHMDSPRDSMREGLRHRASISDHSPSDHTDRLVLP